ncbi:MAG: hypothetical protein LUF30_03410 [Lachnospiraceae bacterium]|nr:hypothetical protein [Lachnospiraceae bacterium]
MVKGMSSKSTEVWGGNMALIKLFSGMDFSGKSTTIERVLVKIPNVFRKQSKFITPIETLQIMIDQNIWVPKEVFIPLLYELVTEDIKNYRECGPILQDTLWVIKFIARLWVEDGEHYEEEIQMLLRLVEQYPDMDSFYLTTTLEARRERYKNIFLTRKRIS